MKNLYLAFVVAILLGLTGCDSGTSGHTYSNPSPTDIPKIIEQPASDLHTTERQSVSIAITVKAYPPFTIDFYRNGTLKASYEETSLSAMYKRTLGIYETEYTDDGDEYYFVISNANGSVTSDTTILTVDDATTIPDTTPVTAEQAAWFEGGYDASYVQDGVVQDETYYFIDNTGIFHAYNYLDDLTDLGANCYRAPEPGERNYGLDGHQLLWKASDQTFAVLANNSSARGTREFYFKLNDSHQITKICGDSAGTSCSASSYALGNPYWVSLVSGKTTSPTLTDIQSAICH